MNNRKTAWLESQYLFPHHFQQQERYFESLLEARCRAIAPYIWGFDDLVVDQAALIEGRFSISQARGVLPDGTPFALPQDAALPAPLAVPSSTRHQLVYIALASYLPGSRFLDAEVAGSADRVSRYRLSMIDVYDYSVDGGKPESIESAAPDFRLLLEPEALGGYSAMPVARIREVTPEGCVTLDANYIPTVLSTRASARLQSLLAELLGMLKQRADALAARFNQPGGNSAISDFLLLQLFNRYEPRLRHLQDSPHTHPERLFRDFYELLGELATFTTESKRAGVIGAYDHQDLYACFQPLNERLSQYLSAILEQTAVGLPVEKRQYGIHVARIVDRSLIRQARFVLAARADATVDTIRDQLPAMLKMGTIETIRELVNNQLPGLGISALAVAPREVHFNPGAVYFEIEHNSELWQQLRNSAGFAFHLAGELPNLEFELWAIRH